MLPVLPNNREWLAPITLTRKQPIAQFVIDRAFAEATLFQPFRDFLFRFRCRKSVDVAVIGQFTHLRWCRRTHRHACVGISAFWCAGIITDRKSPLARNLLSEFYGRDLDLICYCNLFATLADCDVIKGFYNDSDWQPKFLREFKIALIVRWHAHDRAGAVTE